MLLEKHKSEQRVHEGYDFYPQILLPGAVAILPANIGANFIGKCLSPDLAQLGMVRIGWHPYLLPPNNPASPANTYRATHLEATWSKTS